MRSRPFVARSMRNASYNSSNTYLSWMVICSIKRTTIALYAMSNISAGFGLTVNPLKSYNGYPKSTGIHPQPSISDIFPNPFLYLFLEPLPPLTQYWPPTNTIPQPSEHPIPIHLHTHFSIRTKSNAGSSSPLLFRSKYTAPPTAPALSLASSPSHQRSLDGP